VRYALALITAAVRYAVWETFLGQKTLLVKILLHSGSSPDEQGSSMLKKDKSDEQCLIDGSAKE
jgi:hypothetical protein